MNVSCPRCEATFSLPDSAYVPGRKARCSQCRNIFTLPDAAQAPPLVFEKAESVEPAAPTQDLVDKPKKSKFPVLILSITLLLCLGGISFFGYKVYQMMLSPSASTAADKKQPSLIFDDKKKAEEQDKSVSKIMLEDIRQFVVANDRLGNIVVVQGKAMNGFDVAKEFITVEVRLFDDKEQVLLTKQQVAGATLSLFQLQVLDGKELDDALNNKVDILTNNTNVPPGGRVPFFVVFPKVPEHFYEFEVRPIAAKDVPKK